MDVALVQRRTLRLLFLAQIIGGVGIAVGASVGALLAADLAGIGLSGLALSANVVGAALFAVPAAAIVQRRGRRPSLAAGYFVSAVGSLLIVLAAVRGSVPLLFAGLFLFGGASAAGYQARYAAVDLAPAALRGRHLSLIVWATTLGAVVGPAFAAPAGTALARYGMPTLAGPFVFSAVLLRSDHCSSSCSCCGRIPAMVARGLAEHSASRAVALQAGAECARRSHSSSPRARPGWASERWRSGTS